MPQKPSAADRRWARFVSRSVHELRTPLNSIAIAAELLRLETADRLSDREAGRLERVDQAVADVLGLLAEMSELAKLEGGAAEPPPAERVTPGELARGLETTFGDRRRETPRVEVTCAAGLPPIAGERRRIERIVELLVKSALAAGGDGEVTVAIGRGADAGEVGIAVIDTGPRVPEDARESLFEPFGGASARTRRQHGGQGLGLALAAAHARRLGGRLELTESGGTTILTARLPALPPGGDPGPGARSAGASWC